jgi:membrane-bound lytic murein transglycosylase
MKSLQILFYAFVMVVNQVGHVLAVEGQPFFTVESRPFGEEKIVTDIPAIRTVAASTLHYINNFEHQDAKANHAGVLAGVGYTLDDVKQTLQFIIKTIDEDKNKATCRLQDPHFINKYFDTIRWSGDVAGAAKNKVAIPNDHLYITQYLVCRVRGSRVKTAQFSHALYAVPRDETALTEQEAETRKDLLRFQFTKQQIMQGGLEKNKLVKPLVWVSSEGLEEALMQGTVLVALPDGKEKLFHVHKNNGIAYDRTLASRSLQARYWYFKPVEDIWGYGMDNTRIALRPQVSFAGDVYALGLGKIIALRYPNPETKKLELRLGVLADTGGAFQNNLYQLDFFTGTFGDRQLFKQQLALIPRATEAFILVRNNKNKV